MNYIRKIRQKKQDGTWQEWKKALGFIAFYMKRYRKAILFYMIMGILATVMGFASSIASKYLIDAVTGFHSGRLTVIISITVGMALGDVAMKAWSSRISARISVKIHNTMQAEVYDKIIDTRWESLHAYRTGDMLNRLVGDVDQVAGVVIGWLPDLIVKLVQFIGAFSIICYYDPVMALLALISVPVSALLSRRLVGKLHRYNKEMREQVSDIMAYEEDSFQNLHTVKAFNLTEVFKKKFYGLQEAYKDVYMEYNRFSVTVSAVMQILGMITTYICFGWGLYRLWSGYITYGTMTLFLSLAGKLSGAFSGLLGKVPGIIAALTSTGRIMELTEMPLETRLADPVIERQQEMLNNGNLKAGLPVELKDLSFSYDSRSIVFQKMNFYVGTGEVVAVLGPSGKGKTTLMRILTGVVMPQAGCARVGGGHISAQSRALFSYVPQGNTMFAGTIAENLRFGNAAATEQDMEEACRMACAWEFVEQLPERWNWKIGEHGKGLSEGQAQRLAIARALLRKAPVLLMDEATSALDMETEKQVIHNIMEGNLKCTIIISTHRHSVLSECDRIYRIQGQTLQQMEK